MTVSKDLDYFHQNEAVQTSLLGRDGGDLRWDRSVPNAVVITWQISFDQIKTKDPSAATLVSHMSALDRQGIPRFLFCHDDGDILAFDDAVGTLMGFSFVAAEKDRTTV
jgi:hypothetical protein